LLYSSFGDRPHSFRLPEFKVIHHQKRVQGHQSSTYKTCFRLTFLTMTDVNKYLQLLLVLPRLKEAEEAASIQRTGSLEPDFQTCLKLTIWSFKKIWKKIWDVDNDGLYMCAKNQHEFLCILGCIKLTNFQIWDDEQ
jgi:hypothetical protein